MATKRKFKRDYIILESKDIEFRSKERVLPKAFAKVEINEEKSVVALYVENLKSVKDGYRVVAIQSDYETLELGNVLLNEQGKGEFTFNLDRNDIEIKAIAMLYEKQVPLIGFKGNKIDNYEEILFAGEEEDYDTFEDEFDDGRIADDEEYEYEEIEYIEIDDEDDAEYEYEEIEYIEIEDDEETQYRSDNYYDLEDDDTIEENEEYEEVEYVEIEEEPKTQQRQTDKYSKYKERQTASTKKYVKSEQKDTQPKNTGYESMKSAGTLLMPRQIKKGLKQFREVMPFVGEPVENTRWWKIEINPLTLSGYSMPNLGYVNALNYTMYSDTVMNSYKYRHYLFGVQYDEYNKRKNYIYAIPGKKDEQPDKGYTGFIRYEPCDGRNDQLGYWLCFIDSRTRKILK